MLNLNCKSFLQVIFITLILTSTLSLAKLTCTVFCDVWHTDNDGLKYKFKARAKFPSDFDNESSAISAFKSFIDFCPNWTQSTCVNDLMKKPAYSSDQADGRTRAIDDCKKLLVGLPAPKQYSTNALYPKEQMTLLQLDLAGFNNNLSDYCSNPNSTNQNFKNQSRGI